MTIVKSTYYGRARRTASGLWRGSDYMHDQDDDHPWSGFCVLRLAIVMSEAITMNHQIESRAAYASLARETEQNAILRAVYWDSWTAVGKGRDYTGPIKVPARFVHIPIFLVRQWLSAFDHLQTSIRAFASTDETVPICSLQVKTEASQCAFEKVWQVVPGEEEELNLLWQVVWQQMGESLLTAPSVAPPEESFPRVDGDPSAYDLQAYTPTLKVP